MFLGVIWSIKYTGDEKDIFATRMLQWRDVEYLESYIDKHKGFIEHDRYYEGYSLEEVIISIKRDAANLLKYINTLYMNTLKRLASRFCG